MTTPAPGTDVVTVQSLMPLAVALLRGLLLAPFGFAGGVLTALQTDNGAGLRKLLIGGCIGALALFLPRSGEGIIDNRRAAILPPSAAVAEAKK